MTPGHAPDDLRDQHRRLAARARPSARPRRSTLGDVPGEVWDAARRAGVDAVWLMGVWERSPAGLAIALRQPGAASRASARRCPTCADDDVVGSPYCVRRLRASTDASAGPTALAAARAELAGAGLRLILDFVPNHVAPDHPWLTEHPECFVRGTRTTWRATRRAFLRRRRRHRPRPRPVLPAVARRRPAQRVRARRCARRPIDTLVDDRRAVRRRALRHGDADARRRLRAHLGRARRRAAGRGLLADGDRPRSGRRTRTSCSSPRRTGTWSGRCSSRASTTATTSGSTTGWCTRPREPVRDHLQADRDYQERLLRFIENHDEPRAAATFAPEPARAAAVVDVDAAGRPAVARGPVRGLPGPPAGVPRPRPDEPADEDLRAFYDRLLGAVAAGLRDGDWQLCECSGWPDNHSADQLVAWCWPRRPAAPRGRQPRRRRRAGPRPPAVGRPRGRDVAAARPARAARRSTATATSSRQGLYVAMGPWKSLLPAGARQRERVGC